MKIEIRFEENELDPAWKTVHQTHSSDVVICGSNHDKNQKADGMISDQPVTLAVQTADCLPVLFQTRDGRWIGAVHAGWKGILDGILPNAVAMFIDKGVRPGDLVVKIGPSIRQCCFEVSRDLVSEFEAEWGDLWKGIARPYSSNQPTSNLDQASAQGDDVWMNLLAIARLQLERAGVRDIKDDGRCTYCTNMVSHRRSTHEGKTSKERMWSTIAKTP